MGYADRDEILAALNELLEAERAGARVALDSSKAKGTVKANWLRWYGGTSRP
jgi:hypothetical protein